MVQCVLHPLRSLITAYFSKRDFCWEFKVQECFPCAGKERAMCSFLAAEREYGDYLGLEAKHLKIQVQESDPALPSPPDLQTDFCLSIQTWFHVSAGCLTDHLYFAVIME